MGFIEPQSKSQGPGGRRWPPLASGTLVKSPGEAGVRVPGGPWHSSGVWSADGFPRSYYVMKVFGGQSRVLELPL